MKKPESMRRRIVVAYMTFAIGVSLVLAVIAALAVEGIEEKLVDERLQEVATWASPRYAGHLPVEMPAGISFHHGDGIPSSLRGMPHGVREITVDGVDLHVLAGRDGGGEFVVVDHDSEYEKIEIVVYSMFLMGFLAFIAGSLALGHFLANRIVTPITELADAVKQRKPNLPHQQREDELGVLARAFATHTVELTRILDRERFFTGDVSHELRTPLTVISGAAELLMTQTEGDPALHAPAERIYRAAREASNVTGMLLQLARAPESHDWPAQSAAALARAEIERYQSLVANRPLQLRFGGGEDFVLYGPQELLQAAVGNLVRNACQYSEEGLIEVRLAPRCLLVEDTGPGLPPVVLARLRGGALPDGDTGSSGTGLGLGLVQRICASLGATLTVHERVNGGTTFAILFPDLTQS